ncbi:MAG: hypothetical protein N2491_02350 [Negativicutes bacterium]|nr:hypothetical protein [Negativicutes bacterium]
MKKALLTAAAVLTLNATAAFAAPINDLTQSQTAIGLGSNVFYLEHKLTDSFTLGLQNVDRTGSNMDDIYGQFKLNGQLRGIIGSRDVDFGSKLYLGMAVNGPVAPEWNGYAALIAGSEFKEVQIGANYKITHNVDLNLDYHSFMPDEGKSRSDVGIGATLKF